MAQSFSVNGKEYLQSNTLAADFGYTPDYIGKLAREEKILGTQVGRQWFIEPESLKIFLHKSQIEKELRKSELSRLRKTEHATYQNKTETKSVIVSPSAPAALQALAVVLCGLFIGSLSWVTQYENISFGDVSLGVQNLKVAIVEVISPADAIRDLQEDPYAFLAVARGTSPRNDDTFFESTQEELFAVLPVEILDSEGDAATTSTENSKKGDLSVHTPNIDSNFSDEVSVVVDEEGNEFIAPVFRSQSSSSMLFRLVPLSSANQ